MVRHARGRYPVRIGAGILADLPGFVAETVPDHRAVVISDASVADALPNPLPGADRLLFPAGEAHKTRETWGGLTDALLERGHDRRTVIVAMGGGVTTDLAGFVAATFLRGVPWIAVPTTTLAMIDAAVGGKTGVDTAAGKNLVGAFHPPAAVVADPATLATLPPRLYREGLAEAVKHAAILDAAYGEWITAHAEAILARDAAAVDRLVRRSVELKAEVVSGDETEGGRRAILNAGHTVAHAIEQASGFTVPHGEAVAIGLMVETFHAEAHGIAESLTTLRLREMLRALELPCAWPADVDAGTARRATRHDKKNRDGVVHAALLARIGAVARNGEEWTHPIAVDGMRFDLP